MGIRASISLDPQLTKTRLRPPLQPRRQAKAVIHFALSPCYPPRLTQATHAPSRLSKNPSPTAQTHLTRQPRLPPSFEHLANLCNKDFPPRSFNSTRPQNSLHRLSTGGRNSHRSSSATFPASSRPSPSPARTRLHPSQLIRILLCPLRLRAFVMKVPSRLAKLTPPNPSGTRLGIRLNALV
jgi:hypothetical protein